MEARKLGKPLTWLLVVPFQSERLLVCLVGGGPVNVMVLAIQANQIVAN